MWFVEVGEIGTVVFIVLLHAGATAFAIWLWLEFYRAWRIGSFTVTRRLTTRSRA